MAKQRFGINDGYRGTVGTVIGYMWRGRWCLRARPRQVHNPRTELQQAGRTVFGTASRLAAGMSQALRMGLGAASRKACMTARNLFISLNRQHITLDGNAAVVDYPSLVLSAGPVAPVAFASPAFASGGSGVTVTVTFEKNPLHLRASGDDTVYLYAWCPGVGEGVLSAPAARRGQTVSVELPAEWTGYSVHLYGFVTDYAGRASASTYVGELAPEPSPADESDHTLDSPEIRSIEFDDNCKSMSYKSPYLHKRLRYNMLQ